MAKDPAFLFYYQDFLVGTAFLSLEEIGAYIKLLCFLADKGRITEDQILKKIPASIWGAICCKFEKDETGFFNRRLLTEVEKRKNYADSRRKNLHMGSHMESHMEPHMESHMGSHMGAHMENENIDIREDISIKNYKEIIEDLNIVIGSGYKPGSRKTRELIRARLNDGFTVEDFKKVHRIMAKEWMDDPKMSRYLRPETLYSNKFEGYLNRKEHSGRMLTDAQKRSLESCRRWEERMEREEKEQNNDKTDA